jgi:hypothetical protein
MTGVYNKDKLKAQYNDRGAQHGQTEGIVEKLKI